MQATPAGFPFGMPGIGLLIEGAMQQAAQPGRQARGLAAGANGALGCLEPQSEPLSKLDFLT